MDSQVIGYSNTAYQSVFVVESLHAANLCSIQRSHWLACAPHFRHALNASPVDGGFNFYGFQRVFPKQVVAQIRSQAYYK